ncbi:uncharacterized protein BP5553_03358 [Venustampulla echinocandica]|uniref:Uncharacterized protein n=1 Tax=Venustampulla echinocandica TaxID=2656787 RepID=A0A370TU55_9HELO|nr:uncharacterized protein BP5553_03358 [Venustampulla echinocandica]RDL39018.1 hypothetical protein BP5553_03358 [Venustampulla echinocandica]
MLARLTSSASRKPIAKPGDKPKPKPTEKEEENKENLDKPLPIPTERKRPGTSGTELVLRADRVEASTAFQRAQRAEQEYRARRQATIARSDAKAAKVHLGEAGKQFRAGVCSSFIAITLPNSRTSRVVREKKSVWKDNREKKRLEREKAKKEKEEKEKARKEREEKEEAERKEAEDKENVAPEDEAAAAPTA